MMVFAMFMGCVLLAILLESADVEAQMISEVLEEIEVRLGKAAAYVAAVKMTNGAEWWEV